MLLKALTVDPATSPLKMSFKLIFSLSHVKAFRNGSIAELIKSLNLATTVSILLVKLSKPPPILSRTVFNPFKPVAKVLLTVSKNFPLSAASSRPVTKSPTDAKTSNMLVANPPRPLEPTKFPIGPRTDISPFFIKSNPEKNPLAIRLILLRVSSVGFIFSMRVLNPLEIFINC